MTDIDLTPFLIRKNAGRPRTRGRYNASELYFILNGLTTPEQWLNSPQRSVEEIIRMWNGTAAHNQIQDLIDAPPESKKTFTHMGVTLVAKADYLPEDRDEVWEFKSSQKPIKTAKDYHLHQTRLCCTLFERGKGIVFQPVVNERGVFLKNLGEVERDDAWFMRQMDALADFHRRVEPLWEALAKTQA